MTRPEGYPWSAGEAATVNEFLNSKVGLRWLGLLQFQKPTVDVSSTERAALTGAVVAGYEDLLLKKISASRKVVESTDTASVKGIDPTRD